MRNDCIDENLTEAQRARFRTCWVLLAEAGSSSRCALTCTNNFLPLTPSNVPSP